MLEIFLVIKTPISSASTNLADLDATLHLAYGRFQLMIHGTIGSLETIGEEGNTSVAVLPSISGCSLEKQEVLVER